MVWVKVYRDPTLREEIAIKGAETDEEAEVIEKASWFSLLRQSNTWFMVIGAFGVFYTVWVYLTWLPSFLQTSRGFSLKEIGWVASLPFLCGILGVLTGGYVSSRLIRRGCAPRPARSRSSAAPSGRSIGAPVTYIDNTVVVIILLCRILLRPGTDRGHLDPRLRPRRKAPGRLAGRDPKLRRIRRSSNSTHRHRHHPQRHPRKLHSGLPDRRHTAPDRRRLLRVLRQGPQNPWYHHRGGLNPHDHQDSHLERRRPDETQHSSSSGRGRVRQIHGEQSHRPAIQRRLLPDKDTMVTARSANSILQANDSTKTERDNNAFYQAAVLPIEYETLLEPAETTFG
jgi:hypothetical protein